ncbi:MAG TPA: periplasmic heavy metal sensor [Gemmatimonadales bacterium]
MRSTRSAAALLAAAFFVGVLTGAGGSLIAERVDGSHDRGGRGRRGYLERLTHELELTEPQRDSVRAILDRRRPAMDSLRREMEPRFETLQQAIRSDIRSQLTPDQQRKFADMTRRSDSMRSRGGDDRAPR